MEKVEFRAFFYRLLGDQERRRLILENWHRSYPITKEDQSLVDVFAGFIHTLLYGKTDLCIQADRFSIFTGQWESRKLCILKSWLTMDERLFLERTVKAREELFMSRKEYENDLYNYEDFVHNDNQATPHYLKIIDNIWRRQLLRDFCFLLLAIPTGNAYLLDWLCAIQTVLDTKAGKQDTFLALIHGALQGRYPIAHVPCWNTTCGDYHSDVIRERDLELKAKMSDIKENEQKRKQTNNSCHVGVKKRICWDDDNDKKNADITPYNDNRSTREILAELHLFNVYTMSLRDSQNKKLMI